MNTVTERGWVTRTLSALWLTIQAPQWSLFLLIVVLGFASNTGVEWLTTLFGLFVALVLCMWAARALGYDGGNPVSFLFTFNSRSPAQFALAFLWLVLALGVAWFTGQIPSFARWLLSRLPSALAPDPDPSLIVVFLTCMVFTGFSIVALLVRRRSVHLAKLEPLALMNRSQRRANRVTKHDFEEFNTRLLAALDRRDYWAEASVVLGLATIAVIPGALGWAWLWGVTLSIVLPMFILSVRFRVRAHEYKHER